MQRYFPFAESASYVFADDTEAVIELIAGRFIGDNPCMPFVLRAFDEKSIASNEKARYIFDFNARFPDAEEESVCWAAGSLWCHTPRTSVFVVNCFGPTRVYLNGEVVFSSSGPQEGSGAENRFEVSLAKGENVFILRCEKTSIGFGCTLANAMPQWEPCNFRSPFAERSERVGFVFTWPTLPDPFGQCLPDTSGMESDTGMNWFPVVEEICGPEECLDGEGYAYIWTSVETEDVCHLEMRAKTNVPVRIWLDSRELATGQGELIVESNVGYGRHSMLICARLKRNVPWGSVQVLANGKELPLKLPVDVKGARGDMLYLGVFGDDTADPKCITRFDTVFEGLSGQVYWRTQEKDVVIRLFVEAELYGRWTYPLGVTLYGILKAGEKLGRNDYEEYVRKHVSQAVGIHDYALYDKKKYGFPGVNHQIAWLDALDDCGSFGSLMMECESKWPTAASARLGARIANYMAKEQIRLPDGAFYRGETMWADDMYMSVPFLIRYAKISGKAEYLDEACRQLLLYRKYLCMEDCGLMSHIQSFMHDKANRIPWSRGNGWVIFSLSQLLSVLGTEHEKRSEIVNFYNLLVKGYLRLQDENGLWHQVLNDPLSYEESSATAMFLCAFSRGIIDGYMERKLVAEALSSCACAWNGLTSRAIDRHGNIYGVCRGSGFSFSRSYYRNLSWNFNDTHGVGIIILAGVEWLNLKKHVSNQ